MTMKMRETAYNNPIISKKKRDSFEKQMSMYGTDGMVEEEDVVSME